MEVAILNRAARRGSTETVTPKEVKERAVQRADATAFQAGE